MPKQGDIIVRTAWGRGSYDDQSAEEGFLFKVVKDCNMRAYYREDWAVPTGNYRKATAVEVAMYGAGITNIFDDEAAQFVSNFTANNKQLNSIKNGDKSQTSDGSTVKVPRNSSAISRGKKPTGIAVFGRAKKAGVTVGYRSNGGIFTW